MLEFPNVRNEADFIRAYKYALSRLVDDIRRYVFVHGFDKSKCDSLYADRLSEMYMGLTEALNSGSISGKVMEALAFLYHKEIRDLARDCGEPVDDYATALNEYNKVKHLLEP